MPNSDSTVAPPLEGEVLDARAVAALFGIVPRVAARWLTEGRIPNRKIGKRRYALRSEVLRVLRPESPGRH